MKIINTHIYISTQEYAEAINISSESIIKYIHASRHLYRSIESIYEVTERGRIALYKLDSLCEEHQARVRQSLGLEGAGETEAAEVAPLLVRVDEGLLSKVVASEGIEKGQKLARYAAWLLAMCPEGRQNKAFLGNWSAHWQAYQREWLEGGVYGQLIRNPQVWVRNTKKLLGEGWQALVSGREGNQNKRKVAPEVERAVMVIALNAFWQAPTVARVARVYEQFCRGLAEFHDRQTGEVISGLGYPSLSESSLRAILWDKPVNRLALEKHYMSALEYRSKNEPFVWRKSPGYSLAKLTMDDKVMRFSFEEGLTFWAYLVFDVYSGALLGYADIEEDKEQYKALKGLSTEEALRVDKKGVQLLKNALLNTFENLHRMGLGEYAPGEIESERHLASALKGGLLCPGVVFPSVRFCQGGNPQEKKAEVFIKRFKYGVEIEYEGFKARPFLRLLQNRLNQDRSLPVYTIAQGQAMLAEMVEKYNALPHHTLKAKTKWQVFQEGLDTNRLQSLNNANLARHLGTLAKTSKIHRNQYVQANDAIYLLPPASQWLEYFDPTEALRVYSLPYRLGEAWLFQGERLLCGLQQLNEAERADASTGEGLAMFMAQRESLGKMVKESLDAKKQVDLVKPWNLPSPEEAEVEIRPTRRSNKFFQIP